MLRDCLLVSSVAAAVAFLGGFVATYFSESYLRAGAERYVIDHVRQAADPAVKEAGKALALPGAKKLIGEDRYVAAEREIREYQADPDATVRRWTQAVESKAAVPASVPEKLKPIYQKFINLPAEMRALYDERIASTLWDLRIFFATNFVAAILVFACAYWANGQFPILLSTMAIMLVLSLAIMIYMYIDNLTIFRILFGFRYGWAYPAGIAICFLALFVRFGRRMATMVWAGRELKQKFNQAT